MSGIALVFRRDGRPADGAELLSMLAPMAHRGRDGCTSQVSGPIAIGAQLWWSTPEDVGVEQPVWHESGRFAVLLDGRIDNRQEVLAGLGNRYAHAAPEGLSDAHVILRAHDAWGDTCFERVVGSFAVALYDAEQRRVTLVRDQLGNRTLFYHLSPEALVVASEEHAVLAHGAVTGELDETTLVHHVAVMPSSDGATYFANVREIMPATLMTVTQRDVATRQYWHADPEPTLRGLSDAEYAERFRHLLREAVRSRLRSRYPVAVQMSGGIDSTSVAAIASAEQSSQGLRQRTYSWFFDELPDCDEREPIGAVAAKLDLEAIPIVADDYWPLHNWRSDPHHPGRPSWNCYRNLKAFLHDRAHGDGYNVLLTGVSGNHVFCGWEHHVADLLVERRVRDAVLELGATSRHLGPRRALLGPSSRRVAGRVLDSAPAGRALRPRGRVGHDPWWLRPEAKAMIDSASPQPTNLAVTQRYEQHHAVLGAAAASGTSYEAPYTSRCGVEVRHPFRDRRLVEFMLAIPAHQLYNRARRKYLARVAMRDRLPGQFFDRRDYSSLAKLFERGIDDREATEAQRLIRVGSVLWEPAVCGSTLGAIMRNRGNVRYRSSAISVLWQCISLGMWLETGMLTR